MVRPWRGRCAFASGMCPVWPAALTLCALLVAGCAGSVRTGDTLQVLEPESEGLLHLESIPSGARVSINESLAGATPLTVTLAIGTYQVMLAKDGYERLSTQIEIDAGQTVRVSLVLEDTVAPSVWLGQVPASVGPQDGLKVVAMAADAGGVAEMRLWVDQALVAAVDAPSLRWNLDTRTMQPGEHLIRVEAADESGNVGYREASFTVQAGPTATLIPLATPTAAPQTSLAVTPWPATLPTPAPRPVEVRWDEVVLPTYEYEEALYTDPEGVGHPYPLLCRDSVRPARPRSYSVLRVRNEYLELTIMPELGGRIYQCTYLPTGQDLFYNNAVIKPTHWGPLDQGWWLAVGGLEFALPVDEHGYVTAETWASEVVRGEDGSVTIYLSIHELSRDLDARVGVTLCPEETAFHLSVSLANPNDSAREAQFWINAMLSPGAPSVTDGLRFYCPASSVLVHSRGGDALPDAGAWMSWPVYGGRDLSDYGTWRDWLGFFAPARWADYSAVYDEDTRLGVVRAFDGGVAQGVKFFGFGSGFGDVGAYTDDGSKYVEMWGGLTPSFWDYATLPADSIVTWEETWCVLSDVTGLSQANEIGALWLARRGSRLDVEVSSPAAQDWVIVVRDGEQELVRTDVVVAPGPPSRLALELPVSTIGGTVTVSIEEEDGRVVLLGQV